MDTLCLQSRRIKQQAGEWLVHLSSNQATSNDRVRFAEWLAADPQHEIAYNRIEQVSEHISSANELASVDPDAAIAAIRRTRKRRVSSWRPMGWNPLGAAAMAAAIIVGVFIIVKPLDFEHPLEEYSTQVAQVREISLDDGSSVTLGARSRLEVRFSDTERHINLIEGEAFFEVNKDSQRPFLVKAGVTQVQVVGTQFDVHRGQTQTDISVLQGMIKVINSGANNKQSSVVLTAGKTVSASKDGLLSAISDINLDELGAWRTGRLIFEDATLLEVIADANRYYKGQIIIANDEIADLRVTAAFNTAQIKEMIFNLTLGLPIDVLEKDGRIILKADRQKIKPVTK